MKSPNGAWMTIYMRGVPKARARHTSVNGKSWSYTPTSTAKFETAIANEVKKHFSSPSEKPIKLTIHFSFTLPESAPKYYKDNYAWLGHTVKPDLDNLVKSIKDALNGVAWIDDSQIVCLHATKGYSTEDKITILVEESYKLPYIKRLKANFLKLIDK